MPVYWSQSVIIGAYNVKRMLALQRVSTEGLTMNDRPVAESPAGKRNIAFFFALHYGGFHVVYLMFLIIDTNTLQSVNLLAFGLCVVAFLINHNYSYRKNVEADLARKPNIGTIMFFPYARILPMHLTIILGGAMSGASTWALLLF